MSSAFSLHRAPVAGFERKLERVYPELFRRLKECREGVCVCVCVCVCVGGCGCGCGCVGVWVGAVYSCLSYMVSLHLTLR